jgi:hypothetical protein
METEAASSAAAAKVLAQLTRSGSRSRPGARQQEPHSVGGESNRVRGPLLTGVDEPNRVGVDAMSWVAEARQKIPSVAQDQRSELQREPGEREKDDGHDRHGGGSIALFAVAGNEGRREDLQRQREVEAAQVADCGEGEAVSLEVDGRDSLIDPHQEALDD